MAKYRKASEKTISRGKGISTDKLSLSEAKDYFNERAKETGAKRFRHNGQVYDLNGNKITESAPARSSGGGSSSSPAKPKPKPEPKNVGGAKAEQRSAGVPPKSPPNYGGTSKSGGRRSGGSADSSALTAAAVGAGALAAGVATARATGARGENGAKAQRALSKPPARLALPAPNKGGTIIPENKKTPAPLKAEGAKGENKSNVQKAIDKARAKPRVKAAKPKGPGGSRSGVRGGIGVDITTNPLEQIKDPLQLMNKGGMVKKKKKC